MKSLSSTRAQLVGDTHEPPGCRYSPSRRALKISDLFSIEPSGPPDPEAGARALLNGKSEAKNTSLVKNKRTSRPGTDGQTGRHAEHFKQGPSGRHVAEVGQGGTGDLLRIIRHVHGSPNPVD